MKIKLKGAYFTSKKYTPTHIKKFRNKINRRKKVRTFYVNQNFSRNPLAKPLRKPSYPLKLNDKISFPEDIYHINNYIKNMERHVKTHKIIIDHRAMTDIDNASILLLTASINSTFSHEKLTRHKKYIPQDKMLNTRLTEIGYWNALCINPPKRQKNLNYLKITKGNGSEVQNNFHVDIINFFSSEHNIDDEDRENLFDAIFEAMANSAEHAFTGYKEEDKRIWLLGSFNKNTKELEFIFYDVGIGIYQSLKNKKNQLAKVLFRFSEMFGYNKALKKIYTDDLSKYKRKDKKGRGLGIIAFKNFIDKISEKREAYLEIATDDKIYLTKDGIVKDMKKPIKGTLIRWVIGERKNGR